jgi:hypothetical protein
VRKQALKICKSVIRWLRKPITKLLGLNWIDKYSGVYTAQDIIIAQKLFKTVNNILTCSETELRNYDFILQQIIDCGIAFIPKDLGGENLGKWKKYINPSGLGLIQSPGEFAEFALYLTGLKIQNAIEVGVSFGLTSYFLCALLQRVNPSVEYHMVDISERELFCFDLFANILNIKKYIPATSEFFKGKKFDFVFIDGDHSYQGVVKDIANVGQYAQACVAFHDIYGHEYDNLSGGICRAWQEFTANYAGKFKVKTFSEYPHKWLGIGVGEKIQR